MKVLASLSIQTLLVGILACTAQVVAIMYFGKKWEYDPSTVVSLAQLISGAFAGGFSGLVIARKGRDIVQSNKGQYYDEEEQRVKNIE